jgi:transposase-like protein
MVFLVSSHFLLSAKARTLSLASVARMSDEKAQETFASLRWADNGGQAYCPFCGCVKVYRLGETMPKWKCSACKKKFTVTSQTIFADRKLPIRDYLLAIAIFVNGAKGHSALQLSRDLDCQYKSAFVLSHKIREAMASETTAMTIGGKGKVAHVDGAYFGKHVRKENKIEDRKDTRLVENQSGKRQVVVVMRQIAGRTLPFVVPKESDGVPIIRQRVETGTILHADEARGWDTLHASYETKRVNHSVAYQQDGVDTNQAESFFSRLRRAEFGIHHRIAGRCLGQYANEMAWREDHRRTSNGEQFTMVTALAARHSISREWAGYWQRNRAA